MSKRAFQLRRLFHVVNGGTPVGNPENWGGDVTWITPDDLGRTGGHRISNSARTLTAAGLRSAANLVPPGSIVLSTRAPIGHVAIADVPLAFNQGCKGLVPRRPLDERFFYYQLLARRAELQARGQGSTFAELSTGSLGAVRVVCPPSDEQRRIATALDEVDAQIRAGIDRSHRLHALVRERLNAHIIQSVAPWVLDWKPGGWASELSMHAVPPGFRATPLKYTLDSVVGGVWGSDADGGSDDLRCVRVADFDRDRAVVVGNVPTLRSVPKQQRLGRELRAGDLLLEKSGGGDRQVVGAVAQYCSDQSAVCSNFIARLRPTGAYNSDYLRFLHRALYLVGRSRMYVKQTTGIQNLDVDLYLCEVVAIPDKRRQEKIANELVGATEDALRTVRSIERQIELFQERRQALVTAAVTGQLDPSAYHEPAVSA